MTRVKNSSLRLRPWIFPALALLLSQAVLLGQDRIIGRVGSGGRVVLSGNVHPKAQPQYDEGSVDPGLKINLVALASGHRQGSRRHWRNCLQNSRTRRLRTTISGLHRNNTRIGSV